MTYPFAALLQTDEVLDLSSVHPYEHDWEAVVAELDALHQRRLIAVAGREFAVENPGRTYFCIDSWMTPHAVTRIQCRARRWDVEHGG